MPDTPELPPLPYEQLLSACPPVWGHSDEAMQEYARAAILASRATRLAEAPKGWKAIETAPKDGRKLIVGYRNSLGKWRTVMASYSTAETIEEAEADFGYGSGAKPGWYEEYEANDDMALYPVEHPPTHWMPLPPAPDAAPAASSPEAADERMAFEAWGRTQGTPEQGWWFRQLPDGGYSARLPDIAWKGWQGRAALASAPAGAGEGAMEQIIKLNEHSKAHMQALADLVCLAERQFKGHPGREWIDRDQAMRLVPVLRDNASAVDEIGRKLLHAALAGEPAVAADEGRDALLAVGRTLADFAKTAPGRLPSRVQEAIDFIARAASQDEAGMSENTHAPRPAGYLTSRGQFYASLTAMPKHEQGTFREVYAADVPALVTAAMQADTYLLADPSPAAKAIRASLNAAIAQATRSQP